MPLKKIEDKKPGGFDSTQQKGNIVKGKLKSQKELKKITSSDKYKKADYQGKTKMLNVATHKRGALVGGQKKLDKNNNNRIDAQDFKILKAEKAKGRGQGLQDEKMKPGKPMKAALGAIALGLGAKKMMEKKGSKMPMGMGAAAFLAKKKKEMLGKKKGGMFKGYSKVFETAARAGQKNTGTSTIVGVKPNPKKPRKTYKSMEEMRKAKGFKPGESASQFNKRRAALASAKQIAKSSRIGKIALGVAAAGIGAKKYLESKIKKKDKKMGGGMMQKYAQGGLQEQAAQEQTRRKRKAGPGALGRAGRGIASGIGKIAGKKAAGPKAGTPAQPKKKKPEIGSIIVTKGGMYSYTKPEIDEKKGRHYRQHKSYDASPRLISDAKGKTMSLRSMNVGGSVTVKTKLGRNKPTKMY